MSLSSQLHSIDGKGYGAYKSLKGRHRLGGYTLHIDRVQSDPFAPPSSIRITGNFPHRTVSDVAAADHLSRRIAERLPRGGKKEGQLRIDVGGQHVLARTAVLFPDERTIEIRMDAALPADGRRIRGRAAATLLTRTLPACLDDALDVDPAELDEAARLDVDQNALREELVDKQLVSFIADGSILPRRSGDSDLPLTEAVRFQSPESLRVTFHLPSGRTVTGMGVPEGITVIGGGGFHGKSTLMRAIADGVYNHISGDGREFAITRADACSLRAEDGRAVREVDISPFINDLPTGQATTSFSTPNASGSTSQAAWLMEALEAGSRCLLIDEDTSATNFMIRDERMRQLVPDDREPITPLHHRITGLHQSLGTSTVVITGGTSAFLDVADTVIVMDAYQPTDATAKARELTEPAPPFSDFSAPTPRRMRINVAGRKPPQAKGMHTIRVGHDQLDLAALSQLVDASQTRAIAAALNDVSERLGAGASLYEACEQALERWDSGKSGRLAKPRVQELLFAVSHLR